MWTMHTSNKSLFGGMTPMTSWICVIVWLLSLYPMLKIPAHLHLESDTATRPLQSAYQNQIGRKWLAAQAPISLLNVLRASIAGPYPHRFTFRCQNNPPIGKLAKHWLTLDLEKGRWPVPVQALYSCHAHPRKCFITKMECHAMYNSWESNRQMNLRRRRTMTIIIVKS